MSIFDDYYSPATTPQRTRGSRRSRVLLLIGAVAGVLLLLIVAVALWPTDDAVDSTSDASSEVSENASDSQNGEAPESSPTSEESVTPAVGNGDPYAPPQDLGALIDAIHASTVTIYCGDIQGSGWALELGEFIGEKTAEEAALEREYPYEIITNHHVIEPCIDGSELLEAQVQDEILDAYLYSWDEQNDLALVAIKQNVPALSTSSTPQPGWWAMAVGTPYGLEGSIALGNVMNTDATDVVSTAPLNAGMSGGPLVNSRGEVMGTNTWFYLDDEIQDWNVAVGLPALCDEIVDCDGSDYWSDSE